jgi:hypothetical protein
MPRYFAEIDTNNTVLRVIVANSLEWCESRLGGRWLETADPYAPPQPVKYCGPGWVADETFPERFAPEWVMPTPDPETGEWTSYPKGAIVARDGHLWKSTIDGNVWEPGVSAWHPEPDIEGVRPTWIQPTGAHDVWPMGAIVAHAGKHWKSDHAANVWEPGVSQWTEVTADGEPIAPAVLPWVQPTGAHDAYPAGARVTHNGQTWTNIFGDGNIWEPGVFGWTAE